MRPRRLLGYVTAVLIAGLASYAVFVTKPFAQEMMPGGPDMGMPGMDMGMGMGTSAAGGQQYQWTEVEMPEELLMTYGEFLAQEGQAPVPLPEVYLIEDDGTPKRLTRNGWYQLANVYADRPVVIETAMVGTPGGRFWNQAYLEAAVKHNEVNAMWDRWTDALTNFWFEVGYPRIGPQLLTYDWERKGIRNPDGTMRWRRWEATLPESFTITIPVVMRVKDGCQRNYGRKFYNAMKKFDNKGHGRSPFRFMTFDGGHYRPHTFYLADETIQVWNDLWTRPQVQVRLFNPRREEIVRAAQASGLTPAIFTQMVHPPVIYYEPRYRLLMPREDDTFHGGRLNLDGKEGWYYEFEFTLNRDQLRALDDAKARLVVDGGPPDRMKYFGAPDLVGLTGAVSQAGIMPGGPGAQEPMAGGPGEMGMMPMP